jgi:hypothetical protein
MDQGPGVRSDRHYAAINNRTECRRSFPILDRRGIIRRCVVVPLATVDVNGILGAAGQDISKARASFANIICLKEIFSEFW